MPLFYKKIVFNLILFYYNIVTMTKLFTDILNEPKNFVLEGNQESVGFLKDNVSNFVETKQDDVVGKISIWQLPGSQFGTSAGIKVFPMGHLAFYGIHGRRILGTDPDGTPLHECEWESSKDGKIKMTRTRVQLDCQQWVNNCPGYRSK